MSGVLQAWPWLVAMAALIMASGFFSGSEAAIFSLHRRERRRLARRGGSGKLAVELLRDPDRLLSAILFWNLLINMCYFGIAAIVGGRLESAGDVGRTGMLAFTGVSLLAIIFFSEMLPKSLTVLAPERFAPLIAPPLAVAIRLVAPILPVLRVANLAASRLLWPTLRPESEIELSDIERAIELGTEDAALAERERHALRSLVGLAEARAVEVMRPRSRLKIHPRPVHRRVLSEGMPIGGYLMLSEPDSEWITHSIGISHLRPNQTDHLEMLAEPVIYVPWSARVSQVLEGLNSERRAVAVVVNEFGEAIGAITVDDILRDVLAPIGGDAPEESMREIEPDRWRLSGSIAVRSFAKRLGLDLPEESSATLAGYLQRHNERRPRVGDEASVGPYRLRVLEETETGIWIEAWKDSREPTGREPGLETDRSGEPSP